MKCNSCSFIYKKIGGGVPTFNFSNGNPTGAIATTSRNRTKQLRVLAEASNTKVQYKGGIASTNSYISSINCNPNFSIINYTIPTNCSSQLCLPCYNLSILTGGLPGSGFTFTINGGNPSSIAICLINGGTILTKCYTNPLLSGGNPNSSPFYYIDGSNPTAVAICLINGGYI